MESPDIQVIRFNLGSKSIKLVLPIEGIFLFAQVRVGSWELEVLKQFLFFVNILLPLGLWQK